VAEASEEDNMAYREYFVDYYGEKENIIGTFGAKWIANGDFKTGFKDDYWSVDVGYYPKSDMGLVFMDGYEKSKLILIGDEKKMDALVELIGKSAKTTVGIKREDQK